MPPTRELKVTIVGDAKSVERAFAKASKSGGAFGGALKKVGLASGIALAGIGIASVKMAADFDRGIREVRTLLPELNDEGFKVLRQDVLAFSEEVGVATGQVVPALYQAISAGVPPDNALTFLKSASDLAIGGVTDLTSATDLLTSATNAFGKEAGPTGAIADAFFTAVRLGKTTIGELSSAFSTAGPLAAAMGISLDELLASVAAITLTGAPTAEAFTQVRAALVSLQKATPPMAKALRAMGFESGQAAVDALGLQGTLQGLRAEADAAGIPLIKLTGRAEGMQAILALSGAAAERAGDLLAGFGESSGATAAAVDTMNEGFSRQLEIFKAGLNASLITLGERALPALIRLMEELKPILIDVADAFVEIVGAVEKAIDALGLYGGEVDFLTSTNRTLTFENGKLVISYRGLETAADRSRAMAELLVGELRLGAAAAREAAVEFAEAAEAEAVLGENARLAGRDLSQLSSRAIATAFALRIFKAQAAGAGLEVVNLIGQIGGMNEQLREAIATERGIDTLIEAMLGFAGGTDVAAEAAGAYARSVDGVTDATRLAQRASEEWQAQQLAALRDAQNEIREMIGAWEELQGLAQSGVVAFNPATGQFVGVGTPIGTQGVFAGEGGVFGPDFNRLPIGARVTAGGEVILPPGAPTAAQTAFGQQTIDADFFGTTIHINVAGLSIEEIVAIVISRMDLRGAA